MNRNLPGWKKSCTDGSLQEQQIKFQLKCQLFVMSVYFATFAAALDLYILLMNL